MTRFFVRRIVSGLLTLVAISLVVFLLFYVAPSDPARAIAGLQASPQQVDAVRSHLGLDLPVWQRYLIFLGGLLHGNLGYSYFNQQSVSSLLAAGLPVTFSLAIGGLTIALLIGVLIGTLSGRRPGSWFDRSASAGVLVGLSVPTFVIGVFLLYVFFFLLTVAGLPIFPASGYVPFTQDPAEWARHLVLPWFAVAFSSAAIYARLTRSQVITTLGQDYIVTAQVKGLSPSRILTRHVLRSSMNPIVTQLGLDFASLMGGLVVTEQIFGLNGIGRLSIQAVSRGDQPVIIGTVLLASAFVVIANLVIDLVYPLLDPRVRITA